MRAATRRPRSRRGLGGGRGRRPHSRGETVQRGAGAAMEGPRHVAHRAGPGLVVRRRQRPFEERPVEARVVRDDQVRAFDERVRGRGVDVAPAQVVVGQAGQGGDFRVERATAGCLREGAKYYGKRIAAPYGRLKSDLASQTAVHSAAASVHRPQAESSAAQKDYPTQLAQSRMCGLSTPKILYKSMQSCAPFQTSRRLS